MPETRKLNGIIFARSKRANKKYQATLPNGKIVHFGDKRYQQYHDKIGFYASLNHGDETRRKNYRTRHRGTVTKSGKAAYTVKYSPEWFAYNYLW